MRMCTIISIDYADRKRVCERDTEQTTEGIVDHNPRLCDHRADDKHLGKHNKMAN